MSWYIRALAPPFATIVKDPRYSGVQIGGQFLEPGEYPVTKGDTIYVHATVKNTGESQGALWVAIIDALSGRILASKVDSVPAGDYIGIPSTPITVDSDMEIVIQAGVGTTIGQNKTDEWGC